MGKVSRRTREQADLFFHLILESIADGVFTTDAEVVLIQDALKRSGGSRVQAAQDLGYSRITLRVA